MLSSNSASTVCVPILANKQIKIKQGVSQIPGLWLHEKLTQLGMSVRHLVHLKHRNKFKLPKTVVKFYLEILSEKTRGQ